MSKEVVLRNRGSVSKEVVLRNRGSVSKEVVLRNRGSVSKEVVLRNRGSVNEVQLTGEVANTAHRSCTGPHSDHSAEAISLSAAKIHQPVAPPLDTLS